MMKKIGCMVIVSALILLSAGFAFPAEAAQSAVAQNDAAIAPRAMGTCPNRDCTHPSKSVYLTKGDSIPVGASRTWGNGNSLSVTRLEEGEIFVQGHGRFTWFNDSTVSDDVTPQIGDAATCFHYDNPPRLQELSTYGNGKNVVVRKVDVGCLPDAALDIWGSNASGIRQLYGTTGNGNLMDAYYCYTK